MALGTGRVYRVGKRYAGRRRHTAAGLRQGSQAMSVTPPDLVKQANATRSPYMSGGSSRPSARSSLRIGKDFTR